jgi:hypothetical protein
MRLGLGLRLGLALALVWGWGCLGGSASDLSVRVKVDRVRVRVSNGKSGHIRFRSGDIKIILKFVKLMFRVLLIEARKGGPGKVEFGKE